MQEWIQIGKFAFITSELPRRSVQEEDAIHAQDMAANFKLQVCHSYVLERDVLVHKLDYGTITLNLPDGITSNLI